MTVSTLLLLLFIFTFPCAAMWLEQKTRFFATVGSVVTCYLAGIFLANAKELGTPLGLELPRPPMELMKNVVGISILAAVPLLLFTAHFRRWLKHAPSSVLAFGLACVTVCFASIVWWFPFRDITESTKVAGMIIGVFIGGSVNLNAVGIGLSAQPETVVLASTAEMSVSVLFMFFTLTIAKRLLGRYFPAYSDANALKVEDAAAYQELRWRPAAMGLLLALAVAGISLGLFEGIATSLKQGGLQAQLVDEMTLPVTMLFVTMMGIFVSISPLRRRLEGSQPVGDYLMLIFCVAFGTLVQVASLLSRVEVLQYLEYSLLVLVTSVGLHYLLCAWFRIDFDTTVIAQVATIQSAPFISMFADNLKNRDILLSGLTSAIAGYASGTFLGIGVHYFLKWLG
jgi:uncharacterized membrane protein